MHLIVSFAGATSEPARHALSTLELPHLAQLLARLAPTQRLGSDDYSLSTPHELALAAAWGWQGNDGALPFAAHAAAADGIETSDRAWGLLTPAHWLVGRDHVTLLDPDELALDAAASRAFFDAVQPLFESEGFTLAWGAPLRWYAADESLVELPCASLDRVIGRNVDRWLPDTRQAALLRRLQSEVQMLLYPHALNESREAAGQITVNSFWLSGCGRRQFGADSSVHASHDLRRPVLNDDWAAWAEAWQALDAGALRDLLVRCERREPIALTLCGERFAQRLEPADRSWAQRLRARWQSPAPHTVLEAL